MKQRFSILIFVFLFTFQSLLGAEKKSDDTATLPDDRSALTESSRSLKILRLLQPRLGAQVSYLLPGGDISPALEPGLMFGGLFDVHLPFGFLVDNKFDWRVGICVGYSKLSSKLDYFPADMTMIPILFNTDFGYLFKFGLRPYVRLAAGASMASLKDKSIYTKKMDTSSTDSTILCGAGVGYRHPSFPYVEVTVDASFMRLFEKTSGNFTNITGGVLYHFSARGGQL
jgi:hypothetical protein